MYRQSSQKLRALVYQKDSGISCGLSDQPNSGVSFERHSSVDPTTLPGNGGGIHMQRASFGDGSLTSARIVYLFSKRRDLITLAAAAMLSAPFIAMLSKQAPVSYATEALPLGVPAIFSPEYVTMDPPCCDLMHRPHCELSDACYSVLCKEIPTRNPYTMGTRRHVKGMDVYDVANFSSSSPHVVFIPSSPFAAWLGQCSLGSLCTCCFLVVHMLFPDLSCACRTCVAG